MLGGTGVAGRGRAGRWESNSPLLAFFFTFIGSGLDYFLRTKLELQAESVFWLCDYRAGGERRGDLPCPTVACLHSMLL